MWKGRRLWKYLETHWSKSHLWRQSLCDICGKIYRPRHRLRQHKSSNHDAKTSQGPIRQHKVEDHPNWKLFWDKIWRLESRLQYYEYSYLNKSFTKYCIAWSKVFQSTNGNFGKLSFFLVPLFWPDGKWDINFEYLKVLITFWSLTTITRHVYYMELHFRAII